MTRTHAHGQAAYFRRFHPQTRLRLRHPGHSNKRQQPSPADTKTYPWPVSRVDLCRNLSSERVYPEIQVDARMGLYTQDCVLSYSSRSCGTEFGKWFFTQTLKRVSAAEHTTLWLRTGCP